MNGPKRTEPKDRDPAALEAPPTEYRVTSSPEKVPGSHGAGCSPLSEFLESRELVEQGT